MIAKPNKLIEYLHNQDQDKLFVVHEYHKKRSLTANAYAWKLITMIADVMRISKEECYFEMLKRYGQSEIISVLKQVNIKGYCKYYERVGQTTLNGKDFIHYKIYKGSSEFDSKEMAVLIDGIVSEAKELGIETLPPYELERIKNVKA